MEIKKPMLDALNRQINAELSSAYLYLSMSAYLEGENFKGMAQWMRTQAEEEKLHAMNLYQHIVDRDSQVDLLPLPAPLKKWKSAVDVFEAAYKHEIEVTKMIHDLYDLAVTQKDHAVQVMLQWFINEQVEEEASTKEVADNLKRIGPNCGQIIHYDKHLGKRKTE